MNTSTIVIFTTEALTCAAGITANILLLYLMKKQQPERKQRQMLRTFDRDIKNVFIRSLVLSNLATSILSVPISMIGQVYDIYFNDLSCKIIRWFNYSFATVTVSNIVILGVERYFAVFHPLKVPTPITVRKLAVAAWVFGLIIALLPSWASSSQLVTLNDAPKHICRFDTLNPLHKTLVMVYSIVGYLLFSAFLTFINIQITRYIRRRRRAIDNVVSSTPRVNNATVTILVVLIVPYFMSFLFAILRMLLTVPFTHESDVIFRRSVAIIAYSNAVINPVFMIYKIPRFRKEFRNMFRKGILSENGQHNYNTRISVLQRCVIDIVISDRPRTARARSLCLMSVQK